MTELPSWVSALAGAVAAGLITWGALRERLKRLEADVATNTKDTTELRVTVARLEGKALGDKETT